MARGVIPVLAVATMALLVLLHGVAVRVLLLLWCGAATQRLVCWCVRRAGAGAGVAAALAAAAVSAVVAAARI